MNTHMDEIVVFVKEPLPGCVKTRLNKYMNPVQSCSLYKAFVEDFLYGLKKVPNIHITIAYDGRLQRIQEWIGDNQFYFVSQGRGDLGDRMLRIFSRVFSKGVKRCIILGSDSPTLPVSYLHCAFKSLNKKDVVIGPAWDGGFYLIGFKGSPLKEIFSGVSWSKSYTFKQLLSQINKQKIALKLLPPWYDIDDIDDLDFLKTHLSAIQYATGKRYNQITHIMSQLTIQKKNRR